MNHFAITSTLRALMLEDSNIKAMVDNRIYPLIAPNGTEGDFILYQRDGYVTESTKMGVYLNQPMVYINVVSDNYDRSQELAGLIFNCLVGKYDTMEISLEDSTEDMTDKKFIQVLLFKIKL